MSAYILVLRGCYGYRVDRFSIQIHQSTAAAECWIRNAYIRVCIMSKRDNRNSNVEKERRALNALGKNIFYSINAPIRAVNY
jgi:hypothetical protein